MNSIILATTNEDKLRELREILAPLPCRSQTEFNIPPVEESGLSFIENALIKARHASRYTKQPALADDSGLVVEALHGAPGVYTARYAGLNATYEENIQFLLQNLQSVPFDQRQAYFYCAIAVIRYPDDPTPFISVGQVSGYITEHPKGIKGFGYDPVFFVPSYNCTMAELSSEIKNSISHRAKALQHLRQQLNLM